MLRIGLTGGIGSGKSTVARRLEQLGAVLVDADVIAREVVEPGTAGFDAVVTEFGSDVVTAEGTLDRAALGKVVFADAGRRDALNAIVHPLVQRRRGELVAQADPQAVVVEDIPLLVENELGAGFHLVVVVHAPADERVRRLVTNRGMAEDDAWSRVRAQADDDARRARADVWLDNSGPVDELLAQVDDVWETRIVPFEQNLRNRTPVSPPSPVDVMPYDDTWAQQAERLVSRIRTAADEQLVRVDHVGGTSVPGLVARDIIDLLVAVRRRDRTARLEDALSDAGFPPCPDDTDRHASADPGRAACVRLVAFESPEWRTPLLLRDWLYANAEEREVHNELEQGLVATGELTVAKYRDAKAEWRTAALVRAETWAAHTRWDPDTTRFSS